MHTSTGLTSENYNSLLDVAQADECLQLIGRKQALETLLSVIREHQLEKHLGLRLLHKHNEIANGEIMVEESVFDEIGFSLVTRPVHKESLNKDVIPNSWQLTDAGFVPSEYSYAHLLDSPQLMPDRYPEIFSALAKKISDLNLSKLVGPCLNYSSYVEAHRSTAESILFETTNIAERANVLRYADQNEPVLQRTRETKWSAEVMTLNSPENHLIVAARCVCSVAPEGGHLGTHVSLSEKAPEKETEKPKIVAKCVCSVAPEGGHLGTHVSV